MQKAHSLPLSSESLGLLSNTLESLLELVNASACINKLLLAGEEGVALGADFNSDLAAVRGLGGYGFAAGATNYALLIIGMNSGFHFDIPRFFFCDVL
jgi:hypothetical protein